MITAGKRGHHRQDLSMGSPKTASADAAWARGPDALTPQGAAFQCMCAGSAWSHPAAAKGFKQSDAKSSQRSAFGLSSPHLDTITEPSEEWEKAIKLHFTTSCCLFTRGPSYPAKSERGTSASHSLWGRCGMRGMLHRPGGAVKGPWQV